MKKPILCANKTGYTTVLNSTLYALLVQYIKGIGSIGGGL